MRICFFHLFWSWSWSIVATNNLRQTTWDKQLAPQLCKLYDNKEEKENKFRWMNEIYFSVVSIHEWISEFNSKF